MRGGKRDDRRRRARAPRRPLPALLVAGAVAGAQLAPAGVAPAQEEDHDPYVGSAIVTGRDDPAERARGVRESLEEVLVRLSADPDVAGPDAARARVDAWLESGRVRARDVSLADRKAGIRISDEQGTRDRSFVLRARFEPEAVRRLLDALGARALDTARPALEVLLRVDYGDGAFVLSRDGEAGYAQRLALEAVSEALAVDLSLPDAAAVMGLADAEGFRASAAAAAPAAAPASRYRLIGQMRATPEGLWRTRWRLLGAGDGADFAPAPTTFDDAMALAVAEALGALARAGAIGTLPAR